MLTKVLIYVHYDPSVFEEDFNVWIQSEDGGITLPCQSPDYIGGLADFICSHIVEENGVKKADLYIVNNSGNTYIDFTMELKYRDICLLEKNTSAWTHNEAKEIIIKNFDNSYQDKDMEDNVSCKVYSEENEQNTNKNENDDKSSGSEENVPVMDNGKIPLSILMREIAKGGKRL